MLGRERRRSSSARATALARGLAISSRSPPEIDLGTGRTHGHHRRRPPPLHALCWTTCRSSAARGVGGALGLGLFLDYDNRGDDPGRWVTPLPPSTSVPGHRREVATGPTTPAILDDGSLRCWGPTTWASWASATIAPGHAPWRDGRCPADRQLGTRRSAVDITVSSRHHVRTTRRQLPQVLGDGRYGRLGQRCTASATTMARWETNCHPACIRGNEPPIPVSIPAEATPARCSMTGRRMLGVERLRPARPRRRTVNRADIPGTAPIRSRCRSVRPPSPRGGSHLRCPGWRGRSGC